MSAHYSVFSHIAKRLYLEAFNAALKKPAERVKTMAAIRISESAQPDYFCISASVNMSLNACCLSSALRVGKNPTMVLACISGSSACVPPQPLRATGKCRTNAFLTHQRSAIALDSASVDLSIRSTSRHISYPAKPRRRCLNLVGEGLTPGHRASGLITGELTAPPQPDRMFFLQVFLI